MTVALRMPGKAGDETSETPGSDHFYELFRDAYIVNQMFPQRLAHGDYALAPARDFQTIAFQILMDCQEVRKFQGFGQCRGDVRGVL